MGVLRENNWLGQQRLDVPQLRSIESGIRGDFDLAIGTIFAGRQALVVKGFALANTNVGAPATSIQVMVAGSVLTNFNATESGSMFSVSNTRANETLTSLNAKVLGSFVASATNYVSVDLRRAADPTTSDILQFLNATTILETSRSVPLARTLDYVFVISTTDFSSQPNLCPIAKVVTDSSNNIASIIDARQMAFRLAPGGSFAAAQGGYAWPMGRSESVAALDMTSGDKAISSQADWMKAAMTRIQEIGGGEFWYSATADRNVTMIWNGPVFNNGENFEWDGTNLHWKGIEFLFDNSTGWFNTVANQTADSAGLTDLADGECIYVDLDRTANRSGGTALVAHKAVMSTLGPGSVPGARNIIAWRAGLSYQLDFNTQTVDFTPGQVVTGATSGATGALVSQTDAGATGTLVFSVVTGIFIPGEAITDPMGGSAVAGTSRTPIYTRNWRYPVGTIWIPATTTATGVTHISRDYAGNAVGFFSDLNRPVAISDRGGLIVVPGGTGFDGLEITADGAGTGLIVHGGATGVGLTATSALGYAGVFTGAGALPKLLVLNTGTGAGIDTTGAGANSGIDSTGGATGAGGTFKSSGTGNGSIHTGGTGGAYAIIALANVAAVNSTSILATGKGTGAGIWAIAGGTAGADAIKSDGPVDLSGDSSVASGTAVLNRSTKALLVKAWGCVPSADLTKYDDGVNLYLGAATPPVYTANDIKVTLATPMANAFFNPVVQMYTANTCARITARSAAGGTAGNAYFTFRVVIMSTGADATDHDTAGYQWGFTVTGRQ